MILSSRILYLPSWAVVVEFIDGAMEGAMVGAMEGAIEGAVDGDIEGAIEGAIDDPIVVSFIEFPLGTKRMISQIVWCFVCKLYTFWHRNWELKCQIKY